MNSYDRLKRPDVPGVKVRVWQVVAIAFVMVAVIGTVLYFFSGQEYGARNIDELDVLNSQLNLRIVEISYREIEGIRISRGEVSPTGQGTRIVILLSDDLSGEEIAENDLMDEERDWLLKFDPYPDSDRWIAVRNALVGCQSVHKCNTVAFELARATQGDFDMDEYPEIISAQLEILK
jgi:hypothetical protein